MLTSLIERVARLGTTPLYLLTFGLAFGESAVLLDLVVPGEVGMVFVAASVAEREGSLPLLIALCAVGAMAGDSVGFAIGRRWGLAVICRWRWVRQRLEPKVERSQEYFERRGGAVVMAARFVGALRAVVPLVAGTGRMPFRRFVVYDAVAATVWSAGIMSLGYFLGRPIARLIDRAGWVVSGIVVAGVAVVWLIRRRGAAQEADKATSRAPA